MGPSQHADHVIQEQAAMKKVSDLEMDVIRLAGNLPQGTVVIAAKHGITKLHCVMYGMEVVDNIMKEAQEIRIMWNIGPEDKE